jgi:hypothetical protein
MKTDRMALVVIVIVACLHGKSYAADHYVAPGGLHISPFSTWANAAHDIQSAIIVAGNNDTIFVSNGVYSIGATIVANKPLTLKSANGKDLAVINGGNSKRCMEISNGAKVDGFTITGGRALNGAGIYSTSGTVVNCTVKHNTAYTNDLKESGFGGGVSLQYSTMQDCLIVSNHAERASGGIDCLQNVVVERTLVLNNSAPFGGGAGVFYPVESSYNTMANCLFVGNYASSIAGGLFIANGGSLLYCTVADNTASLQAGGVFVDGLENMRVANSIIYRNYASIGSNYYLSVSSIFSNTCTAPLPAGTQNTSLNPMFANPLTGDYRLSSLSPCIDAGTNISGIATDLDGSPRNLDGNLDGVSAADMGCYEFWKTSGDISESGGIVLKWAGATNRQYSLLAKSNLFSSFSAIATGINGRTPYNTYTNSLLEESQYFGVAIE